MKTMLTVFKKELIDSLRDRRTIITMVVVPLLMFPILIGISSTMMISQIKEAQEKKLKIGLITNNNAVVLKKILYDRDDFKIIEDLFEASGKALIEKDSLDGLIVIDPKFDKSVAALKPGKMTLFFKETEKTEVERKRILEILNNYEETLRIERLKQHNLDASFIETLDVTQTNLASQKEKLAEIIGGFLPYIFVIFCFMGSMYPAIDLAAGEKERGTLETLLTAPAGRFQILLGKFSVVVLTGITSAVVSILGLYIGVVQVTEIPPELMKTILSILELDTILILFSLLLPLTIFFAAILLSLSFFAKSFKEAQSIISPLMILVIIPAFIGLMPGMTLNLTTALIPILNISLATKGIIAGNISPALLAEVYASIILYAGISLFVCAKVFERESTIFRM